MEFFKSRKNNVDLFLAAATLLIQIPPIKNSHVYLYLTVFQVVRIYRPIIYIERLRSLIVRRGFVSFVKRILIKDSSSLIGEQRLT